MICLSRCIKKFALWVRRNVFFQFSLIILFIFSMSDSMLLKSLTNLYYLFIYWKLCFSLCSQCISKWAYFPILSRRFLCFFLSLCRVVAVYLYIFFLYFFPKTVELIVEPLPLTSSSPPPSFAGHKKILSTFWPQQVTTSFLLFTLLDHS